MKLTIRTKTIGMDKNIILSIINTEEKLINGVVYMDEVVELIEGDIYTDRQMYTLLKMIDSRHNSQRSDNKINQWVV